MSTLPAGSLVGGSIRAYFAPVDRTHAVPVPFDPATMGRFALDAPPPGWFSLGPVADFQRTPASAITPVLSGAPASVRTQARSTLEEQVQCSFAGWSRIAIALSAGTQTMNLLRTATGASADPSGGTPAAAEPVLSGSTATVLQLSSSTAVQAGDVVVVDADYTGATGYIGSGAAGAYVVKPPATVDPHFTRRVSFNASRVLSVNAGVVTLASALPAGTPASGMKVAVVNGFVDRAGGAFLPEWSGLFVLDGVQGDRLLLHYPRMQPAGSGEAETKATLASGVDRLRPTARLRALPITDTNDGVAAICFRSYLPAPMRAV
jgi:hypothetical protein